MHFLCSKMPKISSFSHCVSPRLPESATKVAVSILRVNYTWGNALHGHLAFPYSCTFIFWVPFWPNFHFFHIFWRQIGTFITTKGSNSAFRALRLLSRALQLLFKTFHQVFLASLSTSARNQEKHQKNAKMVFFSPSAIFFAEKHFIGCRYIYGRTSLTSTNDCPSKELYFQNFRQPYSI